MNWELLPGWLAMHASLIPAPMFAWCAWQCFRVKQIGGLPRYKAMRAAGVLWTVLLLRAVLMVLWHSKYGPPLETSLLDNLFGVMVGVYSVSFTSRILKFAVVPLPKKIEEFPEYAARSVLKRIEELTLKIGGNGPPNDGPR